MQTAISQTNGSFEFRGITPGDVRVYDPSRNTRYSQSVSLRRDSVVAKSGAAFLLSPPSSRPNPKRLQLHFDLL